MNSLFKASVSKEEFAELFGRGYRIIPVYREFLADLDTPVSLFYKLDQEKPEQIFLLESVVGGENIGRYSFLGRDFYRIFRARDQDIVIEEAGGETTRLTGNPLEELERFIDFPRAWVDESLPGLFGGAIGYISYDSIRYTENIPATNTNDLHLDDVFLAFCNRLFIFDQVDRVIRPVVCALLEDDDDPEKAYERVLEQLAEMESQLRRELPGDTGWQTGSGEKPRLVQNMTDERFREIVEKCREYIRAGDIFQVVPSRRVSFPLDVPAFQVYRALRKVNPSPYMYYLWDGRQKLEIIGSSPEILVRKEGRTINLRPIAGTRPRGHSLEEDQAHIDSLLADPKEIAEHLMLIDLGRNDVGKVSEFETVEVNEMMVIEKYSHVMHIVSNVKGELREDLTAMDALRSALPAGTLSGAPKIRAMEIIDEMEPTRRGPYGGALGYIGFSRDMDMAIVIRTLLVKDGQAWLQAGAGIVYDSDPATETEEVANKMRGLLRAVELARGELL